MGGAYSLEMITRDASCLERNGSVKVQLADGGQCVT